MKNNSTLRLMTFNILVDKGISTPFPWESRRSQVVSLLKFYNPDIFCIQEALEHQKKYLQECFPDYLCFGVGRNDGKTDGEQVPIFHRKDMFDLKDEGYFWLSDTPKAAGSIGCDAKCPRTVVWKKLVSKEKGSTLLVANTHYDHKGKNANLKSAHVINKELSSIAPERTILLCGDFNSPDQSPAYEEILSFGFLDATAEAGIIRYGLPFTYHRFAMDKYKTDSEQLMKENDRVFRSIDHVFYRGKVKALRYGVLGDNILGVYPSDHFPVLCEILYS